MKYRKKPVVIDAFRLGVDPEPSWFIKSREKGLVSEIWSGNGVILDTLEGPLRGDVGSYIIRGVEGEIYSCRADIFEKTYEKVYTYTGDYE